LAAREGGELTEMHDDRRDREDLEGLGYDEQDIEDLNLTIQRDGDTIVVVDGYGDEVNRHDENEVDR
jgi:hypothetical protein